MLARERDIEMNKEDIKSKPEAIRWGGLVWKGLLETDGSIVRLT
jgi:hypothetical protein